MEGNQDRGGFRPALQQTPIWDGKPPNSGEEGWHLLRKKPKGYPDDGFEAAWRYVPGASYHYNGPQITPWHRQDWGVAEERHVAGDWDYVGRLVLEPCGVH